MDHSEWSFQNTNNLYLPLWSWLPFQIIIRNMPTYSNVLNQYQWPSLHWNYFWQWSQAAMDAEFHQLRRVFDKLQTDFANYINEALIWKPVKLLTFDIITDFLAVFPFYFEFLIRMALRTAWFLQYLYLGW